MSTTRLHKKSPLAFFVLVFMLIIPFTIVDALNSTQILRGVPLAGLAFVCPTIAAIILEYKESRGPGVKALLMRSLDVKRIKGKVWYLPTILLYPAVLTVSFFILRLSGYNIPNPSFSLSPLLFLSAGFFIGALGEELGWSGYAIEPLQSRWGALKASLIVGSVWAIWHWIPLLQIHRSMDWVAWWSLYTVAARVIMVWLFNNMGKSVFAMVLFHMILNLAWQLFPINGSYLNQPLVAVLMAIVAVIVVFIWEPKTLTKYRLRSHVQEAYII